MHKGVTVQNIHTIVLFLFISLFSCSGSTLYGMDGNTIGAITDDVIRELYPGEQDSYDDGVAYKVGAEILRKLIYEHNHEVPIAKSCTHAIFTKLSKKVASHVLDKKNPVYKGINMYHQSAKSHIALEFLGGIFIGYDQSPEPFTHVDYPFLFPIFYSLHQTAIRSLCETKVVKYVAEKTYLDCIPESVKPYAKEALLLVVTYGVLVGELLLSNKLCGDSD